MEHAIGESFFGGGSEALLLNLAARKFQSLGPLIQAWRNTGLPADEVYQYVWMRHGFVPRLIADRQRALRELARNVEPATYQAYVNARQNLARVLLVSVTDDAQRNAARVEWIRQLNSAKEELEHQLTVGLEPSRSRRQADDDIRLLCGILPERSVFVDFISFASLPYDATVPSRSQHGAPDRMAAFVVARNRPIAFVDVGDLGEVAALVAAVEQRVDNRPNGEQWAAVAREDLGPDQPPISRRIAARSMWRRMAFWRTLPGVPCPALRMRACYSNSTRSPPCRTDRFCWTGFRNRRPAPAT